MFLILEENILEKSFRNKLSSYIRDDPKQPKLDGDQNSIQDHVQTFDEAS